MRQLDAPFSPCVLSTYHSLSPLPACQRMSVNVLPFRVIPIVCWFDVHFCWWRWHVRFWWFKFKCPFLMFLVRFPQKYVPRAAGHATKSSMPLVAASKAAERLEYLTSGKDSAAKLSPFNGSNIAKNDPGSMFFCFNGILKGIWWGSIGFYGGFIWFYWFYVWCLTLPRKRIRMSLENDPEFVGIRWNPLESVGIRWNPLEKATFQCGTLTWWKTVD